MNMMCRLFGHKRFRVTVVNAHDGKRYYAHPKGNRVACRRCHRVLRKGS